MHDYFCEMKTRTSHDTHRNFYYGMRANGVSYWKAKAMYWAVATFGPDWTVETRVRNDTTCAAGVDGIARCTVVPKLTQETVARNSVDLGDPEVLAIATHEWPDSRCNVRWRANGIRGQHRGKRINLRTVFSTKSYRTNPELVGIVAEPNIVPIDAAEARAGNQLTA